MSDHSFEDWRQMTPEELSKAYDNGGAVANSAAIVAGWAEDSARLRAARPQHIDIPYGPRPEEKWDFFPATDPKAPCLVFIHGGYWQRNTRRGFSCIAEGALALGWSAALPGYTLAPEVTLADIAAEMRLALDFLAARGKSHGLGGPVVLSGWSAGGHLTALMAGHPATQAALAISGIFDLEPIRGTALNDKLRLSDHEIETLSPKRLPLTDKPVAVAYGALELPELRRQSKDFQALRAASRGKPGQLLPVAGANHFSILDGLRTPDGALMRAAVQLLAL